MIKLNFATLHSIKGKTLVGVMLSTETTRQKRFLKAFGKELRYRLKNDLSNDFKVTFASFGRLTLFPGFHFIFEVLCPEEEEFKAITKKEVIKLLQEAG